VSAVWLAGALEVAGLASAGLAAGFVLGVALWAAL